MRFWITLGVLALNCASPSTHRAAAQESSEPKQAAITTFPISAQHPSGARYTFALRSPESKDERPG